LRRKPVRGPAPRAVLDHRFAWTTVSIDPESLDVILMQVTDVRGCDERNSGLSCKVCRSLDIEMCKCGIWTIDRQRQSFAKE